MDKANALMTIKRVAAALLMACFFMPLARCTTKADPESHKVAVEFNIYECELAQNALRDIKVGQFNGVATLGALFIVFFVPAVCLGLKDSVQTPIYLLSSVAAAYLLYCWIFLFATTVRYGGVIAVLSWIGIFCAAGMSLLGHWRIRTGAG